MKIFSKILAVLALSSFCFAINLEPLENACKSGNENACKAVGAIKGKIADCDSGLADVCLTLGLSMEQGSLGYVHLPTQIAKDYFKKACDLNYKEGCDNYKRLQ